MADCSRYLGTRIFHFVVVVVESYEYPNFALKYGNSRFPTALGSYPEYLYIFAVEPRNDRALKVFQSIMGSNPEIVRSGPSSGRPSSTD